MGASTSFFFMRKDSAIILEALEDVTENGSKTLALQDLASLDLSLVESLVSIARIQAGPGLLGQLKHFSIKDCRMRVSSAAAASSSSSSPLSAATAMHMLTTFLRHECSSLREIDLSRNDLNNDDLAILCNQESGLGGHLTLTSLILRGNRFQGLAGGQCLRQLLTLDDNNNSSRHRVKLVKLDLSENIWLGIHGIRALSMGLTANQQYLQELVLQNSLLDDECVAMLMDSMIHVTGRDGNSSGGGGSGVRILNLSRNHMTPASLRSLSRLLMASSCCLEVLDVSHNNSLFDEDNRRVEANAIIAENDANIDAPSIASCVKTFAHALKRNGTMHHLNIQHCGVENFGAKCIFRALEFNSTLRVMDIGNPYIKSPAGLDCIIQSIPKMKGLQHVKVFIMSTPSTSQQENLVHALHKNTTLCSLASYCEWSNQSCFEMEGIFFRNWGMARVSALLQYLPRHDDDERPVKTIAPPAPSVWCKALASLGRYHASGATPVFLVLQAMLPASLNDEPDVTDCTEHFNSNDSNNVVFAKNDRAAISLTTVQDPQVSSKSINYVATKSSFTATNLLLWCGCLLWRILHMFWYFFASPVHALNNKDAFFCWWETHSAQAIAAIYAKRNETRQGKRHDSVKHAKLE